MRAKTVIVGGGVMGVSIAMHAARRHDALRGPVVLFERDRLGSGSSGRSGAVLRQFYGATALAGMARDSLRAYANFAREKGRSIGFTRSGVLTLCASSASEDVGALERTVEMLVSIGVDARRVDASEMRALVPALRVDDGIVGAFEPHAGTVDPELTVDAIAALARSYGAVIRAGCPVRELVLERGRVVGVRTADGLVECERVVIATGPWTPRFLQREGVELPLYVLKTEQHFVASPGAREGVEPEDEGLITAELAMDPSAMAPMPGGARLHEDPAERALVTSPVGVQSAAHPVLLDQELGFYTRCEPERGRTRVGRLDYGDEPRVDDPDAFDESCRPEFGRWSRERLEARFPLYRELEDLGTEAAMYTLTPDANAVIGPLPGIEGAFVVSGFSGHGFKLAPSVGEGVAEMLAGEPVSAFDPEFFSPRRFEAGALAAIARPFGL